MSCVSDPQTRDFCVLLGKLLSGTVEVVPETGLFLPGNFQLHAHTHIIRTLQCVLGVTVARVWLWTTLRFSVKLKIKVAP